jgi:hypothetical protein
VFNDPNVTVPEPTSRNYQVFIGYDEGPPKAKKEEQPKRVVRRKPPAPAQAARPAPAQQQQPAATSESDIPR